jgi:hypothetical protein
MYNFEVTGHYVPENRTPWYVTSLSYTNTVLKNSEDVSMMLVNLFPNSLAVRILSHFHAMTLVMGTPCNLTFLYI